MEAGKPPRPPPPLPPRLDWFVRTQVAQLTAEGIPEWFHGTISREAAEKLLEPLPAGSFLIRVSHSHVGYTLSCRAPGCCRHFMVKMLDDGRVSGPDGEAHASLDALVTHHRRTPLRPHGDLLTEACPSLLTPLAPVSPLPAPDHGSRAEAQRAWPARAAVGRTYLAAGTGGRGLPEARQWAGPPLYH
ncbi:hematopoietic SH2 domain-containing protein-like [Dipodomys merriami]|uniref:hematopoietic SH2 domain-containing protein-like n=1 Tax=Dipodomys merriami TaxID=94247 RepID=UPI00385583A9